MEIKNMRTYNILKVWLKLLKGAYMYTNNIRWRFKRGLPMGLKFSPIVFDLYFYYSIKDLIEIPEAIVAFADDTTIVINENISFNYFLQLKQSLNNFKIEINYHKSEILTVYNNDSRNNVSKFRNLGFKILKKVKLLGKMIKYNGDKSLIQDRKQLEDLIKFKINKLFKIPLKLQVQMLNSFYVSRIRYMYIVSTYYERRSRIEFTNELIKSFNRLTYIKLEEEEKDIVLVQLNLVKLILLVLSDDDIIKLMRSNIEEKMEVIKIIYELLYETFYIKENNFMEKMKNIFMELNNFDDIKIFKKYIKIFITKKINLHIMEEYKKLVDLEIDKIYRKEIIVHRIFWLLIKDFNTVEKNKVIYGMNIIKIKIILEQMYDNILIDMKNNKKVRRIMDYTKNITVKFLREKDYKFKAFKTIVFKKSNRVQIINRYNERLIYKINEIYETYDEAEKIFRSYTWQDNKQQEIEVKFNLMRKYKKVSNIILQKYDMFIEHIMAKQREINDVELIELFKEKMYSKDENIELIEEIEFNKSEDLLYKIIHYNAIFKEVL